MFNNFSKTFAMVFMVAFAGAFSQDFDNFIPKVRRENVARLILNSKSSPEVISLCFDSYNYYWNASNTVYRSQYDSCLTTAAKGNSAINEEVASNITYVITLQEESAKEYEECNEEKGDALAYFQCTTKAATNAAKTSRDIQNISNDRIQYVTMRSDMVKYDCDDCTGKCNAAHNAELAKVEEGLLDCLSGKIPPPTPPTPTTSSTTTSPTPSSTTTTAQPSVETTTSDE
ncbi:uncharacterized protein LOC131802109 [Musca domestica]|uniref:Uncharacterized protein LOC131802109 n=1 Tax=Musca domestica TaxID=7370 RepID=A0ABM3UVC6_MUSDO|nr:uncharacterized protein LOC131802109 [Musca domestica]